MMQMREKANIFDHTEMNQKGPIRKQVIVEKDEEDSKSSEFASEKSSSEWGSVQETP
jgi:hypothetical protein